MLSRFFATALLATGAMLSQGYATSPNPTVTAITSAKGDAYLEAVMKAVNAMTRRDSLSAFTASSLVNTDPADGYASVCIQKLATGMYRSHSTNPAASGVVSGAGELAAFGPLFQLNTNNKFILNVSTNPDGTGEIKSFIGQIFLKDGDGTSTSDVVCFARYPQIMTSPMGVSASPAGN